MSLIYKNIAGSTAVTLIESYTNGSDSQNIDSINLCNTHDTNFVTVNLYYYKITYIERNPNDYNSMPATDETFTYYILKNIIIPKGTTLNLDNLSFNNIQYSLVVKLKDSDSAVDIVIDAQIQGTITTDSTLILNSSGGIGADLGGISPY